MQPVRSEDGLTLQRFSVMLTSCKNALKEIGYQSKIENLDTMQKIVERLPFGLRQKWREKADSITEGEKREVSIEDIANFVEAKASGQPSSFWKRLRIFQGTSLRKMMLSGETETRD